MPNFAKDRDSAILWAREILKSDFLITDTKTTGLDEDDEAVSIGLVAKSGDVLVDTKLCHQKECSPKALATHGIGWEETRQAPHFRDIYQDLTKSLTGKILVGYNTDYDMRIIDQTATRYELPTLEPEATWDVMYWFAKFYGDYNDYYGSYRWKKLTFAAEHFGLSTEGAHGAAQDCLLTLAVLRKMAESKLSDEKE